MGICPKCQSSIEHDFGIISCGNCGTILSIDFDGNVTLSDPDPVGEAPPAEPIAEGAPLDGGLFAESDPFSVPPPETDIPPVVEAAPLAVEDFAPLDLTPVTQDLEVPPPPPPPVEAEWHPVEEGGMGSSGEAPAGPPDPPPGPVDFSDVVNFANSEFDNSSLVYSLRIEGIDHKETRQKVLDVLGDIRLNIHVKDLIPTIKGGILELHDLNPVKANIIASRLRDEEVTFRWRQSVFQSQSENPESP